MAKIRSHFFSLSLSRSLVRVRSLSLFTSFQYKCAFAKSLWETFARIKVLFDEYNVPLVFIWFYFILYTFAFPFLEYIYLYSCLLLFVRLFHFNRVVKCREKGTAGKKGKKGSAFSLAESLGACLVDERYDVCLPQAIEIWMLYTHPRWRRWRRRRLIFSNAKKVFRFLYVNTQK